MTRAEKILSFIGRYIRTPEGALVGTPLELLPFQEEFIRSVYDNPHGTKRGILSIARKQGKTTLISALMLVHLVGPEAKRNAQLISAAMSREQAAIVFKLAALMVRMSPELASIIKIVESRREMHGLKMGTTYRAIAAEAGTAHGMSPLVVVLDEAGQIKGPQSDFVSALTTAQGAHSAPLFLTISTQAANDVDLLSTWIDDAQESKDARIVCRLYAAPEGCKLTDKKAWMMANPAAGVFRSMDDIEQQALEAVRMPSQEGVFRNLILNQRCETTQAFVSRTVWEANAGPAKNLGGMEVWGGLDLSTRTDLTSLVLIGKDTEGVWHSHSYFWTPQEGLHDRARRDRQPYDVWVEQNHLRTTPGQTVDYEYVARDIIEICTGLDIQAIAFDPHRIEFLNKEFDRQGATVPLVMCHQGFNGVNPGICNLEAELLNARIRHGGHPVLQMCAAGATTESNAEGQRRFNKRKSRSRIDGIVALGMAFSAAFKAPEPETPPKYEVFFV